ncbi:hypothetical protein HC928_02045 [bacterium]|nr:hypothetical protein [bacterium]
MRFVPPEPGLVMPSVTFDSVRTLAEAFARGYMEGCDTLPLEEDVRDPVLLIVIGTNNARITVEGALEDNPFLLETGDDWMNMVKEFQDFLIISGYTPELRAAYGYDAEAPSSGPEWSDRTHSLKWVQDAELENNMSVPYVFYGDANRAPRLEAKNDWSQDHVVALEEIYNIAWGEARLPLPIPQIYSWAYAQEWYNVRRYAQEEQNDSINIYGILTSCVGVPENVCLVGDERNWQEVDIDPETEILTPEQAWEAMYQIHNAPRSPSNESVTLRPALNQVLMTDLIYQGASAPAAGAN